jgi:hypothetical protein
MAEIGLHKAKKGERGLLQFTVISFSVGSWILEPGILEPGPPLQQVVVKCIALATPCGIEAATNPRQSTAP